MDWCSVYLTPQGWLKYIYLSPLLIFPTTYNGIRTKNARCESLRALLPYVEWDRFVTLAGGKSEMRVTLSYLELRWHNINWKPFTDNVLFMIQGNHMKEKSMIIKKENKFWYRFFNINMTSNISETNVIKPWIMKRTLSVNGLQLILCHLNSRYDNVTLTSLLPPARVTNRSHTTYGSNARSDSHQAFFVLIPL
jgi:hypothetical protein